MRSFRTRRLACVLFGVTFGIASRGYAQNPIQAENALTGTPGWELANPATHHEIEGYASLTSVLQGNPIDLFVNTSSRGYNLEIFRMGWYNEVGARRVYGPQPYVGMTQDTCPEDVNTGLIECNWRLSVRITPGSDWVSGYYLAKLTTTDTDPGHDAYIIFIVRDDRASHFLMQASVTTWQAYNPWPGRVGDDPEHTSFGKSLYEFNSGGARPMQCSTPEPKPIRACRVSFNRPYALGDQDASASGLGAGEFLTNLQPAGSTPSAGWEYNMVRFLEQHGYDVTYCTDVDTHERGDLILRHSGFLSVGHDEYWSSGMRSNVEAARDRPLQNGGGVNLAFFSANTCYWQIRFDKDRSGALDRTIIGYKDDFVHDEKYVADVQALNEVTYTWGPGAEYGWVPPPDQPDPEHPVNRDQDRSEEKLLGIGFLTDKLDMHDIVITNVDTWVTAGADVTPPNDHLMGLLGYEVDGSRGDGFPPADEAGLVVIAQSPYALEGISKMTFYTRRNTNAIVFATGTIQWSWGLDDYNRDLHGGSLLSTPAQIITQNVLNQFRLPH